MENPYMDFCVNGPLVYTDGSPVGGYIDNGIQIQEWMEPAVGGGNFAVGNGIFGVDTYGDFHMVSYENRNELPQMRWAFQNGLMLVQNGINIRGTSPSKNIRSGIGYDTEGNLVVIVTLEPATLYELAELFIYMDCVNAIYLDGAAPYVGFSRNDGKRSGMVEDAIKLQFYKN
jgi:uncharacterized protein YigE (DUF2233 family)